uniref:Carboxylic ester hydrolase n=1 Tax=Timema genevievae TaxID=629358 RepID=A0A7R9PR51_TIMGE|nr:unnamed protein product [Timema genevievae]
MLPLFVQLLSATLLLLREGQCTVSEDLDLQVVVSHGTLQGHRLISRNGREFNSFQRIPFAKPPVGDLRFKMLSAQPPENWSGVRDATKEAPICPQRNIYMGDKNVKGQEDCLYLNVYTPQLPGDGSSSRNLPVLFWIHGGGWLSGGGTLGFYSPAFLMDKDIVLVSINYRLGPLGFLSTGDEVSPGNIGLKDQVTALRWVRDNIARFGGDPGSVTIFGESAGGASVHYHMISPLSRGLFHRAISQSGTALCPFAYAPGGTSKHQAEKLAVLLDCPTNSSEALVSCLRKKEASEIIETDYAFWEWEWHPHIPFRPVDETSVAEGEELYLAEDPRITVSQNKALDIPWMELDEDFNRIAPISMFYRNTSNSIEEITPKIREFYFGDHPINNETVYAAVDMFTDNVMLSGTDEAVKKHRKSASSPVFYYYFDYKGTNTFASLLGDASLHDYAAATLLSGATRCIDTGRALCPPFAVASMELNPTPETTELIPELWEPVTPDKLNYFYIGHHLGLGSELLQERANFWASLPIRDKETVQARDEL